MIRIYINLSIFKSYKAHIIQIQNQRVISIYNILFSRSNLYFVNSKFIKTSVLLMDQFSARIMDRRL